jgi:probable F420-dependent oxidoreductase
MRVELSLMTHPFHENPVWPDTAGITAAARNVEDLGFDGILVPEAGGHDPFFPLLLAAHETARVTLRTGVAVAFPRSPMVMAQIAWDLQRFSSGRFELGLGTQVKGQNARRYAAPWTAPPGPRLREYILCMQAMFETFQHGERPRFFTGKHYQFTLMPQFFNPGPIEHPHVPIYIAAVNPYMCRLAGALCDGIFPHPICTARYMREVMLPAIAAGAGKAGRQVMGLGTPQRPIGERAIEMTPTAGLQVLVSPMIATGRDAAEIKRKTHYLKQRLGFYASTRSYHAPLEMHGFLDVGQQLFRLSMEGKWREMIDLVSDEMLDTFATVGSFDELGPKLKARWGGLASVLHLDLPPELREDETAMRALLASLR